MHLGSFKDVSHSRWNRLGFHRILQRLHYLESMKVALQICHLLGLDPSPTVERLLLAALHTPTTTSSSHLLKTIEQIASMVQEGGSINWLELASKARQLDLDQVALKVPSSLPCFKNHWHLEIKS